MLKKRTSTLAQCLILIAVCLPLVLCQSNQTTASAELRSQTAFGVARNSSVSASGGTLSFPQDISNVNGWYNHGLDNFEARSNGFYFLFICVGVAPRSQVRVQQVGGYPKIGFTWQSTSNNGSKLGCRGGISILPTGMRVRLSAQGGGIYSDNLQQTSFSAFSISDAMTSEYDSLFVSYSSSAPFNTLSPIPFGEQGVVYVNPRNSLYNGASYSYTCPYNGYYLVSITVGISSGQFARVLLTAENSRINFELTRTSRATNGVTTLSRSVLVNCTSQTNLQVLLIDGEITSADATASNIISLTIIPYAPVGEYSAWALYHNSSWSATNSSTALIFNRIELLDGVTYNANGTLNVSKSGTYMVYLSAATVPNLPVNLVVKRNGVVIFGLVTSPTESDGVDTVEHGVIVELAAGDKLDVIGANECSLYSDTGLQVGFWGFFLNGA